MQMIPFLSKRDKKKETINAEALLFPHQTDPESLSPEQKEKDLMKLEQAKAQRKNFRSQGFVTIKTAKSDTTVSKQRGEFGRTINPFRDEPPQENQGGAAPSAAAANAT